MKVIVAGASGLIGSALCTALRARGDDVTRLVRRAAVAQDERFWDPSAGVGPGDLSGFDAVVNLAGAGVADHRLTAAYRETVLASRLDTTGLIATAVAEASPRPVLIQGSAIGAYGSRGDTPLHEDAAFGTTFFAGVVRQWEAAARPAAAAGARVVLARTGIVLSRDGGAMARTLPLLRWGLGGPIGSGRQYWSWITLEDEVAAIVHLLGSDHEGPVHLVAQPTTNRELTRAIAAELHRPAVLAVPPFALRIVLGEFATEVLSSVRALPDTLLGTGFVHRHPDSASAARWLVAGDGVPAHT